MFQAIEISVKPEGTHLLLGPSDLNLQDKCKPLTTLTPFRIQKMDPAKFEPITSLGKLGDYEGSIFWMLRGVLEG